MRVLVTGALGFVGGHLRDELARAGHDVFATDISGAADDPSFVRCDLLDAGETARLLRDIAPDAVAHLAARSSAGESFRDPRGTLEVNLFGTLNLLEGLVALRCGPDGERITVLSAGSADEYGMSAREAGPLTEEAPLEPVSPYAASKVAQEHLVMQYARVHGIRAVATRSFSHTGPGQTERFVLPSWARQCAEIRAGLREPVIRVGNTDVVRDYLDVRDVAAAYRLLIERGAAGGVYNVCSGRGLRLSEALEVIAGEIAPRLRIERDPALYRPADIPELVGDGGRIARETGWSPRIDTGRMLADLAGYWDGRVTADGA